MSYSDLLWDSHEIRGKHIPSIQDALLCCDVQTLLLVVERLHASRMPGWADSTPQQRRVARKRMKRALAAMKECPVRRKDGKRYGLFPEEHFVVHARAHAMLIERCIRMRLVDFRNMSLQALPEKRSDSEGFSPPSSSPGMFGFLPWSIALSYRIWLEGPWSCQERYMALADVFWQLTHQGFGNSDQGNGADSHAHCQEGGDPSRQADKFYELDAASAEYLGVGSRSSAFPDGKIASSCVTRHADRSVASVPEMRCQSAADMGLLACDALEEAYLEKLLERVDQLNGQAEKSLLARLDRFADRRVA